MSHTRRSLGLAGVIDRPKTSWFAVIILFVAGLCAAMQFAKVVPVMTMIGDELALGLVASSFAISILGLVGVVFAIAIGATVNSFGLARVITIALFGGALFAALGAVAPNAPLFLLSRFCEGFSHLIIAVTAPALMAAHTTAKDRPIALALWACFFGLGFAITSLASPFIVPDFGWRGLLFAHAALMFAIGCLLILAFKKSGYQDERGELPTIVQILGAHLTMLKSGAPLLLAITFCSYTILFLAILTFVSLFLTDVQQWSSEATGLFLAIASLVTLIFTLGSGFLVRAGVTLFAGLATAFIGLILTAIGVFILQPGDSVLIAMLIFMMACFGLLPGFVFANVPVVAPTPALATCTYGAIALFGNLGTFLGTPIFAASYNTAGWTGGAIFMIAMALMGLGFAAVLDQKMRRTP
jgi:predicted MFS family arabinose efflux permease